MFSTYIKIVKSGFSSKSVSNEFIVGELLSGICRRCGTKNKMGDCYENVKELSSLLMNRKANLPREFRLTLIDGAFNEVRAGVRDSIFDMIAKEKIEYVLKELNDCYIKSSLGAFAVDWHSDNLDLLTFYLIKTANIDNKKIGKSENVISRANTEILVVYDDILRIAFNAKNTPESKIVIIPVDADFNMHVSKLGDSPFIVSPNTIHGKWLIRMNQNGYNEKKIVDIISANRNGKIGDVAAINYKNNVFWLLACSKMDKYFNAHSSVQDIETAIKSLLAYYDKNGQGYTMYVPLIGTGMSRAGMSNEESFQLLKRLIAESIKDIYGKIIIVRYAKERG